MAHFVRIIKAEKLKNQAKAYSLQKEIGFNGGEPDDYESSDVCYSECQRQWFAKHVKKNKTGNSLHNLLWTSSIGFIGGISLAYLSFFLLYLAVHFSLRTTTHICGVVGVILCLSIAFSSNMRCCVLLLISVFFSKQGRQALLAYALFLAFTGPANNMMHNMGVLSDSMACSQEMDKKTLKHITDMMKPPCRSAGETIEELIKLLKQIIRPFQAFIMKLERAIITIIAGIKMSTAWLGSIVNVCNKKIGTPFQRCMKAFDEAVADCKAKLGVLDILCQVGSITKALCYTVKSCDFICTLTEFISDKIVGVTKKKLREFSHRTRNWFYVSIEFTHTREFETKASNKTRGPSETIFKKLFRKIEELQTVFGFFGFIFSLLFLLLIINVYYHWYKFLCSDQYDNVYINKYIIELDIKRALMDRETVLPLEPREKKLYTNPTTFRLVALERSKMTKSIFFLRLTAFKILTFLVADYSLFWMLLMIYEEGRDAVEEVEKSKVVVHLQGRGVLVNFDEKLGKTLQVPPNPGMPLTPLHCLPDPTRPDLGRYIHIGFLVALCLVLTLFEPYGLRLRNAVMSHYYPDRARERAVWLYNHILRSRSSFLRCARRQLRRKFGGSFQPRQKASLLQRLFVNVPLLRCIFGGNTKNKCLCCGATETKAWRLKWCKSADCQGRYCEKCFCRLENICTICQHPLQYGDASDCSEEIDSSEEDSPYRNLCEDSMSQEYLTFKDMEVRDRFRDAESNRLTDYAKLGDLYQDRKALKRRLKTVLRRHIQNIKSEKERRVRIKESMYKLIRYKIKSMISTLQRKKSREATDRKSELKRKFAEKIDILKRFKREKGKCEGQRLLDDPQQCSRSSAFLKVESGIPKGKESDLGILKEKLRVKMEALKERKRLGASTSIQIERQTYGSKTNINFSDEKSGCLDDSCKEDVVTYYFVENEKDEK